jgi:hypothetical protein
MQNSAQFQPQTTPVTTYSPNFYNNGYNSSSIKGSINLNQAPMTHHSPGRSRYSNQPEDYSDYGYSRDNYRRDTRNSRVGGNAQGSGFFY